MNILLVGDVAAKAGRRALADRLPELRVTHDIDLVVANVENLAGGNGVTPETASEILKLGVDAMTSGNHIWDKKEIYPYMDREGCRLLRPYNMAPGSPGKGMLLVSSRTGHEVAVLNLMGRVFMHPPVECPFRAADAALATLPPGVKIVIVDMHGEATSEKQAMAHHLAGRVTCVVGTHTHVQTADERILPPGTATITDLGLTGAHDGIIGMRKDLVLRRFLTQLPVRFEAADGEPRLQGAIVTADAATGRASRIERLDLPGGASR